MTEPFIKNGNNKFSFNDNISRDISPIKERKD
jgi:hypothetical protein